MGIKLTPADKAFSLCVRERENWTCGNCGKHYPDLAAAGKGQALDCSHHIGQGNWSVRFEPMNAECLCCACHFRVGGTHDRMIDVLGEHMLPIMDELKNDLNRGKLFRKTKGKGDIAKHYRAEYQRMRELRAEGRTGRIEFEGFL